MQQDQIHQSVDDWVWARGRHEKGRQLLVQSLQETSVLLRESESPWSFKLVLLLGPIRSRNGLCVSS